MEDLNIIKIGGNVIDDSRKFLSFLRDFSSIDGPKILVHGGGKIATEIGNRLGIVSKYVDGRRVTDDETIDLVTMVYGGLINKKAVVSLQSYGCNAIGITGADGNLIPAVKRPEKEVDFGWVGDLDSGTLPVSGWQYFLTNGFVPVIAPLTHDGRGHMLNTNADTIAAAVSIALSSEYNTRLIYCFEKKGILKDMEDDTTVISSMDFSLFAQLKDDNRLFAGILPKLQNAFDARKSGVGQVVIGHSDDLRLLIENKAGTQILLT